MFSRGSCEWVLIGLRGWKSLEAGRSIMENVSRRKVLSLLGLGASLGFTLSGVLEPSVAEAQEAAPAVPNPTAPATGAGAAEATGTPGTKRRKSRHKHRSERRHSRHARRHTHGAGKPAEAPAATAPTQ
jgi:hypothetical protein